MKKIMILAGGNDQIALIQELRQVLNNDVFIILIDMNPNAKAIPYADKFLPISTMDITAVKDAAKAEDIDMILTACGDQPLQTMSKVSEELGLPCYLSTHTMQGLINKKIMKTIMVNNGIPTSKFVTLSRGQSSPDLTGFKYPLVIKPVDNNGSKGVTKITEASSLEDAISNARNFSLCGDIIVEEYNDGIELSIDAYIENGQAKVLSIISLDKILDNKDSFTIVQSHFPPEANIDFVEIKNIAQKIADTYSLQNTPLLIQGIITGSGFKVIEYSARMGGGSKFRSIKEYTGVDIMNVYVRMVLGQTPHVLPQKLINYASMCYIYCKTGVYNRIHGLDELIDKGIIEYYYTYKNPNTEITKSNTSSDRVAGFMVIGKTRDEVNSKIQYVDNAVMVLDHHNTDIMKHGIYRTI